MRKFFSRTLIFALIFSFFQLPQLAVATSSKTWTGATDFSTGTSPLQVRTGSGSVILNSREHTTLAAGEEHSLGLSSDGKLWSWGDNYTGQAGLGAIVVEVTTPTQVGSGTDWVEVSAGRLFSIGLQSDGTLWAWGDNTYGELGLGDTVERDEPTQVGSGTDWVKISVGSYHTIALKSNGTIWAWGRNDKRQLGLGDTTSRDVPIQIGVDTDWFNIMAGRAHSLAIKTDGSLWSWGTNNGDAVYGWGQLGLGEDVNYVNEPTQVGADTNWSVLASGHWHVLAIQSDGTLWGWGLNDDGCGDGCGQVGLGAGVYQAFVPTQVGVNATWSGITGSYYYSHGLRLDGTLWSWGYGGDSGLGLGDSNDRTEPTEVGSETSWDFVSLGSYSYHSLARKSTGTLWGWGDNYYSQLGLGVATTYIDTPTQIGVATNWAQPSIVYSVSGTLSNLIFDATTEVEWSSLLWSSVALPSGSSVKLRARTSDDNSHYSDWSPYFTQSTVFSTGGSASITGVNPSRYIQLEVTLTTSDTFVTPTLNSISVNYVTPETTTRARNDRNKNPTSSFSYNTATNIQQTREQLIVSLQEQISQLMKRLIELLIKQLQELS